VELYEQIRRDYEHGALGTTPATSAVLLLFRKIVFTLDGVLHDIAGSEVHLDSVITREFLTRWISIFGFFHSPLSVEDWRPWSGTRCGNRWGRP